MIMARRTPPPPADHTDLRAELADIREKHKIPPNAVTLLDEADDATLVLDDEIVSITIDGVALTDPAGTIQFASPRWGALHGTAPATLVGRPLESLHTDKQRLEEHLPFMKQLRAAGSYEGEVGHRRVDGSTLTLWRAAYHLTDVEGEVMGVIFVVRELEPRRDESAREADTVGPQKVLDAIPDGYALLEVIRDDGGQAVNGRFHDVNPAFETMTGLGAAHLLGRTILQVLPDTESDWIEACGLVEQEGYPVRIESFSNSLNMNLEVLVFRTAPHQVACLFQDVTERTQSLPPPDGGRLELRALAHRLMTGAESERSSIAKMLEGGIDGHLAELGTKLGMVQAALDRRDVTGVTEVIDEAITRIGEMGRTVHALLDRLRPEMLEQRGLFATLAWYAERYSKSTSLLVLLEGSAPERRLSSGTELAAFRIVEEALGNAARHAGTSRATIRIEATAQALLVSVRDDGRGFEPRNLPSTGAGGGLGLVYMREQALGVGGGLRIDSAPGRGTQIIVTLPLT